MYKLGKLKAAHINDIKTIGATPAGPMYFITDGTLDSNYYKDITSIHHWDRIGRQLTDRMFVKERISDMVGATSWANLKTDEKDLASKYFCVGATYRAEIHTEAEQLNNWKAHVSGMAESRVKRWSAGKTYISFFLNPAESFDISQTTKELSENFIDYGIISYEASGATGLVDWVTGSTALGSTGFPGKSYWTQEHEDKLVEILVTGLY